ncbi:MAG TPA: hypothetical protein VNT01_16955 [Symbiobacteriaceae bacterium]|nr:hypothetical protein [Symbiobacteriaceae bacterium]
MKQLEVEKGELQYQAEGWATYATDDDDVQIMQWENVSAGKLAWMWHEMLRRHALSTNALQRLGTASIIVKRLELIDLTVVVKSTTNSTDLTFVGSEGTTMNGKDAKRVPGAKPSRLTTMEDVSLHTARSLRAHLAPLGLHDLELRLRFGIEPGGACLLQVPNPLDCSFGSTDYEAMCAHLE